MDKEESKQLEDWNDEDLKELMKFHESRCFELVSRVFHMEHERLEEEALVARPTKSAREDAYVAGFRHGEFTGLEKFINLPNKAGEILKERSKKEK